MKNVMNAKVFCTKNALGTLDFYLEVHTQTLYLFTTRYFSNNIYKTYSVGRRLEEAYTKTGQIRQQKLKERILRMSKYAAEENEFDLPTKTKRRVKRDYDYEYEAA